MYQLTFDDATYLGRKKSTRRQRLLQKMEHILPWDTFRDIVKPHYPKGKRGRPPIPLETMLRIYFMQQWFNLSDPAAEDAILDNVPMRVFAGLKPGYAPGEATIRNFRNWMEETGLAQQVLGVSSRHLRKHGVMLREGIIVDATIKKAPSLSKEEKYIPDAASSEESGP